jgi:hypothetical protein
MPGVAAGTGERRGGAPGAPPPPPPGQPDRHPRESAAGGEHRAFEHELESDVPPLRAERSTQADLAGALAHGDQHHCHDADPAGQQGQEGHAHDELIHGAGGAALGAQQGRLVLDHEEVEHAGPGLVTTL